LLRNRRFLDLKFRRQYGVAGFVVDFYCPDLKLAVEIDGSSHDGRESYDAWRQRLIEEESISFVRITTDELVVNPDVLLERIREVRRCASRVPRERKSLTPNPSPTMLERGALCRHDIVNP
jgi:very-short-patch-repair endonuclease